MTEHHSHPSASSSGQRSKSVPAVVVGNFRVVYRPQAAFERVRRKLARQGFQIEETAHFLVGCEVGSPLITLVHRFSLEDIDNNVGYYLVQELTSCGVMTSDHAFGSAMVGVVSSLAPHQPLDAWRAFLLNTLQRLRERMDDRLCGQDRRDTSARLLPFIDGSFSFVLVPACSMLVAHVLSGLFYSLRASRTNLKRLLESIIGGMLSRFLNIWCQSQKFLVFNCFRPTFLPMTLRNVVRLIP